MSSPPAGPAPTPAAGAYGWLHAAFVLSMATLAFGMLSGFWHHWQALRALPSLSLDAGRMGQMLARNGHATAAAREFRMVLAIYPNDIPALYQLASLLSVSGPLEDEAETWQRLLQLDPNSLGAWSALGRAQLRAGHDADAERSFVEAVRLEPGSAAAHRGLGDARLRQGRAREALSSYRRTRELTPDDANLLGDLGLALAAAGRLEEAEGILVRAESMGGTSASSENLRRVRAERERRLPQAESP